MSNVVIHPPIIYLREQNDIEKLLDPLDANTKVRKNDKVYLRGDLVKDAIQEMLEAYCLLCIRINPQHADCNWCSKTDLWRLLLKKLDNNVEEEIK